MEVEIYCDESRPELLVRQPLESTFMVIGALKIAAAAREKIKQEIKILANSHDCHGEVKWGRISRAKQDFYKDLIQVFISEDLMKFRCIVVDASKVNMRLYHDDDPELAFYKFYYQVFNHQLLPSNTYKFFFDEKTTHDTTRLRELRRILGIVSGEIISGIYPLKSNQSVLIQMTDLLTGCVQARFNTINKGLPLSQPKREVLFHLEEQLGHQIQSTAQNENKFNIFQIRL